MASRNTARDDTYPAKLTRKAQVVVPAEVRRRLGLRPGQTAVWVVREGEAALMTPETYARATAGILAGTYGRTKKEIERYLEGEREGWE